MKRILVATDGSPFSRTTADYVARMAGVLPLEVDLALVVDFHKIEYKMIADLYVDMILEGAKASAEKILSQEAEYLRGRGVAVRPRILQGDPAAALCQTATEEGVELLVLGRRGHGDLKDLLFGSVSNQIVHRCSKPALILKKDVPLPAEAAARRPLRVLAAVDGSRGAQDGLEFLASFGPAAAFEVTLLSVVNPARAELDRLPGDLRHKALVGLHEGAEALLEKAAARLPGFAVSRRVEEGKAGPTICHVAQEDDHEIVVIGRRGLGEIEDMITGSVSHHVLHHCPCHVLLVP